MITTHLARVYRNEGLGALREYLGRVARRNRGNIRRMAHDLGVSRRHLYRYLSLAGLYEEVVAARRLPPQAVPDPVARALREL